MELFKSFLVLTILQTVEAFCVLLSHRIFGLRQMHAQEANEQKQKIALVYHLHKRSKY